MFKAIFSFNGRIRRTEYALTRILVVISIFVIAVVADDEPIFRLLYLFPMYVQITQNVKRCHDRGNSGWWMLIPFYSLVMLFGESEYGPNEYGDNPKGEGNHHAFNYHYLEENNS